MPYRHLAIMAVLSFVAMYILMYAMVNAFANVYPNVNQFYMAGLMTAPMVIIELVVMGGMYKNRLVNRAIIGASAALLVLFWLGIRHQAAVNDIEFLKSMIPHHAGAILMCREASLEDPAVRKLCEGIVVGQQAEIDQMKADLARLQKQ